jgi:hypothetical protein
MSKKKPDKKIPFLETTFQDILVCKKNDGKPYLEIFIQEPENIAQENLGTIAGILEITDESEESSYIVNYLISVIKKEYYSKTKRGAIESFEAALHRANLALAKLAEHENIGWIGKINALILMVEKNNIHLSQVGSAHVLLLRGKSLTDISEGEPPAEFPNPLKTFVDVVSGKLEKNDKLIITTEHIFDIFSFEEIKRSALKFSPSEFVQFLKTALGNELTRAAVLFIEIKEKEIAETELMPEKKAIFNAWSQKAFSKKSPKIHPTEKKLEDFISPEERQMIISEQDMEMGESGKEFVDKKTGHIYIKEDNFLKKDESHWIEVKFFFEENFSRFLSISSRLFLAINERVRKIFIRRKEELAIPVNLAEKFSQKLIFLKKFAWNTLNFLKIFFRFIFEKIKKLISRIRLYFSQRKKQAKIAQTAYEKPTSPILQLLPRWSRIKTTFSSLDYSQKIYAILGVALLFIAPYFISKFNHKTVSDPVPIREAPKISLPLENDKNVIRVENLNTSDLGKKISLPVNLNDKIFAIAADAVINLENKTAYPFPPDFQNLKTAFGMDDLNLIFLLNTQNKIISWSPITGKFQNNEFSLPDGADIALAKTYLTYLYLLDAKNKQIYRYPRAGNGFGEKTDWIKESFDFSDIRDMALSDNIYLAQKSAVTKLFRGKKQDFNLENTATPVLIDKIFTRPESQNIYLLDKTDARVIKLGLNGNIISQYYNPGISSATDFTVDEKNALVYFSSGNNLSNFSLNL